MPLIIDDIAVAAGTVEAATAASETAGAFEATTAGATMAVETPTIEATSISEVVADDSSLAELPTSEEKQLSPDTERGIDLSDASFVDELPSPESSSVLSDIGGLDEKVFYDEYPVEPASEANPATETISEGSQDINTPKTYDEFCETRNCGGSYKEIRNEGWGWNDNPPHEVHHMPADSASNLEREDGPAIAIEYSDHQQTASCGSSREAKEYRAAQKELIDNGDFRGALQMDIDDLHDKFGDKYDVAISQMLAYVDKLEQAGKI